MNKYLTLYHDQLALATTKPILHNEVPLEDRYNELIMAVGQKFSNETRHQTALRYIRQCESQCKGTVAAADQINKTN